MKRITFDLPGIRLAGIDFGGEGPFVLLLHGLMGRASTWLETASWLTPHFHVIGFDQRGHGGSDKPEDAYARDDYVNDAIQVIEKMQMAPAIVIGHSMGALNAWVLAARRPDLVRCVVLEDMGATAEGEKKIISWRKWFKQWPLPFQSMSEVRAFFGRKNSAWGDYFMEVFSEAPDGYRPVFSFDHMLQSVKDWALNDYWKELESVSCPALIVRGEKSDSSREELEEMARRLSEGRFCEVAAAGHVIHFDQPAAWRTVVEPFVMEFRN